MAAAGTGIARGRGRALPDGRGESAPDRGSGAARGTSPQAGRAHAARGGNRTAPHQPRIARRSRSKPAVHSPANELVEQALPEHEGELRAKLREARDLTERTI